MKKRIIYIIISLLGILIPPFFIENIVICFFLGYIFGSVLGLQLCILFFEPNTKDITLF